MDSLSIHDILKVTGGRLLSGSPDTQVESFSTDTRTLRTGDLFIALEGKNHDGHSFVAEALRKGAIGALISKPPFFSPPSKCLLIETRDPLEALGSIAHCWRLNHSVPLVAVTGSNGKTTTKDMISSVLGQRWQVLPSPGNFNNLIGLPLSLLQLRVHHEVTVVELGMNAPGEISRLAQICRPDIGIITNVGPAHLEFLGSVEAVAAAKAELLPFLDRGLAILNRDDPYSSPLLTQVQGKLLTFGLSPEADLWADSLKPQGSKGIRFVLRCRGGGIPVSLPTPGLYNVYNALAAATVGWAMGMDLNTIARGLEETHLPPMRMELIQLPCGARILNDAYNANPASMKVALETFFEVQNGGRAILLLADMLELGPEAKSAHFSVGELVARLSPDLLITMGELSEEIANGAIRAGMNPEHVHHFQGYSEVCSFLSACLGPDAWVFLKGSRGMHLERILEGLKVQVSSSSEDIKGGPG